MAAPRKARTYLTDAEKDRLLSIPVPEPVTPDTVVAFRRRHHLRVVDLARLLGVDPTTVTLWERPYVGRGARVTLVPRYASLIALALMEIERRLEALA